MFKDIDPGALGNEVALLPLFARFLAYRGLEFPSLALRFIPAGS
jgi:hypothetical protein